MKSAPWGRHRRWLLGVLAVALTATAVAYALRPRKIRLKLPEKQAGNGSTSANHAAGRSKSARLNQIFGGEGGLETLLQADRVVAFRIEDDGEWPDNAQPNVLDFPIVAGPVVIERNLADRISAALASTESYGWEFVKGCLPEFGACSSFFREDDRVDILLCFECDVLMVARNGVITDGEDFDAIRPLLLQTVKSLFPDDVQLQSLSEEALAAS